MTQIEFSLVLWPLLINKVRHTGLEPDPNDCLINFWRPKLSLNRLSSRKLPLIRLSRTELPLIRPSRHKESLIRLFRQKAFSSEHLQTMVHTQIQSIVQTLIRPWSDWSALEIVWSEKDFTYEQISNFAKKWKKRRSKWSLAGQFCQSLRPM